ncbi:MAG: transposase [Victivallales bacterium]|jgi:REP element-mobilizing transposase RayT
MNERVEMQDRLKECGTGVSPVFNKLGYKQPHPFIPFSPDSPKDSNRRYLPHWQQSGTTYFVTFRLADSLPVEKVNGLREQRDGWLLLNPEPWNELQQKEYSRLFSEKINEWLDAGFGDCILSKAAISEIVENSLLHFDEIRYVLDEYVVMPNHVHALISPLGKHALDRILHSLKSFTAHAIGKKLDMNGAIWMDESYDHIVRSMEQLEFYRKYIMDNPSKARLGIGRYRLKKNEKTFTINK